MWIDLDVNIPLENGTYKVQIKNLDKGNTIEAEARWNGTKSGGFDLIDRTLTTNEFIKNWWSNTVE